MQPLFRLCRPALAQLVLTAFLLAWTILHTLPAAAMQFDTSSLTVETGDHHVHPFTVELALTSEQQARGLMFRDHIPSDHGMLFLYQSPQVVSYWMRNCLVPMDMLFIAEDGRITNIQVNAEPGSEKPIYSSERVLAVLELQGGLSVTLGIKPGDHVHFPNFDRSRK